MLATLLAIALYIRGMGNLRAQGRSPGFARSVAFFLGVAAMYAVTQTHYDYLSQYLFFAHRGQHLVLHHLAPFLIALAVPWPVLAAGVPASVRSFPGSDVARTCLRTTYRVLQHPLLAPVLFVGLIYFWLLPQVHFDAMLNRNLYQVMNWSMALDGLLFWWLMLDPRSRAQGALGYGLRILILIAIALPQIFLGASITFSERVIFDVYEVCGRAWPIAPLEDQQWGGLLTWIPAAMMSVAGSLIVLSYQLRSSEEHKTEPRESADVPRTAPLR